MIAQALRSIARMPGLAAVVILSLGIGIGVNTAVFSWIQAVVLKPLPAVADATSYFSVEPKANTGTYPGVSWREYRDFQERLRAFQDVLAFRMVPFSVGESSRTERAYGMLVSGNYFSVLNLRPALGRFIEPREATQPGTEPVVVISHDYWQTHFAGSPNVLGQSIPINEHPLTIVGVAPETFQGTITGLQFDLFAPATMAPALLAGSNELDNRNLRGYQVMGLLRDDVSEAQAQTELTATMADLERTYPESNADIQGDVKSFGMAPRGPQRMIATGLYALQGMMLLVLLAVCGNTANLVLARASSRYREVGVRLALGAGPARVIRLLLVENVVLALLGAGLGIVIAIWGTQALRAMPAYGALPIKFQTSVDSMGLAFAIGLGLASGVLFGLVPALQLARVDPQQALRAGSRWSGRSAMRDGLMGFQVAMALLILVVAGLFFRSFVETRELDPGFRADGVLLAAYDLTGRSTDDSLARSFATRLLERLRALPSVEAAAIASNVPLDIHGLPARGFTLEGRAADRNQPDQALSNIVTSGYFTVMGIAFVAGNDFVELADTAMAPQVIVNEEFVRRFLDGREPLGRRLDSGGRTYAIAGVVKTSTYEAFGEPPTPAMYFGFRDRPRNVGEIHLRTRPGTESVLGAEVQSIVRDLDPTLPVYNIRTLTEHIDKNLILRKVPARLFVVVAPLLLALVSIGIYAVVAYAVSQRTSEIGVRLALGATANRIVRQIVIESLQVIGFGALCGWVVAFMIDLHLIRGGIADAPVLIGVPLLLLSVAALSCWLPARRATLVDPVVALRQD
ncbi:MAG: ABC transporter permease [Vicinamibacterales bacterium]